MKNSRRVYSNQNGPNENLEKLVYKHLQQINRAPIANHNRLAYREVAKKFNQPVIFDSGCGTGLSTQKLAQQYPDTFVVGIDKSAPRLKRHQALPENPGNYQLVRADLIDFWRLAAADGLKLYRHFILYPNPWPKKSQINRRWQGSPAFAQILELGGKLELRSNWKIYVQEFSLALSMAGYNPDHNRIKPKVEDTLSNFEKKYLCSDHELWQLTINLDDRN